MHLFRLGVVGWFFFGGGGGGIFISARHLRTLNPTSTWGGEESFGPGPGKSGGLDISLANWGASFQTWTVFLGGGDDAFGQGLRNLETSYKFASFQTWNVFGIKRLLPKVLENWELHGSQQIMFIGGLEKQHLRS